MRPLFATAALAAAACAHPQPVRVVWRDVELGRPCGPRAQVELVLDRACSLTITANREAPRRAALARRDCDAVFALAASEKLATRPGCTVPQPFIAGVEVTLGDARAVYACWDDPLAGRLGALADRVAPGWERGAGMSEDCDFHRGTIEIEHVPRR